MDLSMGPLLAFVICVVVAGLVVLWLLLFGFTYICCKCCEDRRARRHRTKVPTSSPMTVQLLATPDREAAEAGIALRSTLVDAGRVSGFGSGGGGGPNGVRPNDGIGGRADDSVGVGGGAAGPDFQYVAFRERPHFSAYGPLANDRWSVDYSSNRSSWYDRNSSFRRSAAECKRDDQANWSYAELLRGAETDESSCRYDDLTLDTSCNSSRNVDTTSSIDRSRLGYGRGVEPSAFGAAGTDTRPDAAAVRSQSATPYKTATIKKASSMRQASLVSSQPMAD